MGFTTYAAIGLLCVILLFFALYSFLHSAKPTAFSPKITFEEGKDDSCIPDVSFVSAKGYYVDYKNSSIRVDVCRLSNENEANQVFNSKVLPILANEEKDSISIDSFSGFKFVNDNQAGIVLQKNEILLFCTGGVNPPVPIVKSMTSENTESVCRWFIEENIE